MCVCCLVLIWLCTVGLSSFFTTAATKTSYRWQSQNIELCLYWTVNMSSYTRLVHYVIIFKEGVVSAALTVHSASSVFSSKRHALNPSIIFKASLYMYAYWPNMSLAVVNIWDVNSTFPDVLIYSRCNDNAQDSPPTKCRRWKNIRASISCLKKFHWFPFHTYCIHTYTVCM